MYLKGYATIPELLLGLTANTKFRQLIKNEGPSSEEFESIDFRKEKVRVPDAVSFLVFQSMKPGIYKFFGNFHPDMAQGRFIVK